MRKGLVTAAMAASGLLASLAAPATAPALLTPHEARAAARAYIHRDIRTGQGTGGIVNWCRTTGRDCGECWVTITGGREWGSIGLLLAVARRGRCVTAVSVLLAEPPVRVCRRRGRQRRRDR